MFLSNFFGGVLELKTDFHTHSNCSDGALSPAELVLRAHAKGVQSLALTDHDTCSGVSQAIKQAAELGVQLIPGIEMSCVWGGATVHVLGLGVDPSTEQMRDAEHHQERVRRERALIIAERVEKKSRSTGLLAHVQSLCETSVPGRPHIANAMVDAGIVSSNREAFQVYLGAGKIGDVKSGWPELETVINWIVGSGGVAVVAHPRKYKFTLSKLRKLFDEFKAVGGKGVEVSVGGQKQGETGLLADLCRRHSFYASAGSDFHAPGMPWSELGSFPSLPAGLPNIKELLAI